MRVKCLATCVLAPEMCRRALRKASLAKAGMTKAPRFTSLSQSALLRCWLAKEELECEKLKRERKENKKLTGKEDKEVRQGASFGSIQQSSCELIGRRVVT